MKFNIIVYLLDETNKDIFADDRKEFEVEIDLSDSEKSELRELIDPVADLSDGLMPLLENKAMRLGPGYDLYDKFLDLIIPKVFVEFLIDGLNRGYIQKSMEDNHDDIHGVDFDTLFGLYGPDVVFDSSDYVCEIPKELIPKVYLTKHATKEDIYRYLMREQQDLMWSLYHNYTSDDILYDDNDFDISTWCWIEERLTKIVSERIKEATPESLLRDDYNPLNDINKENLAKIYPDTIIEN